MKKNAFHLLKERGFIEQATDEEGLLKALRGKITCYAGFDPTASSLHVGHLLPIMALAHLQKAGHRPLVLLGGGTALIGDPSGKNEMRKILSADEVLENAEKIKKQFSKYIDFEDSDSALLLNNETWLVSIKYIEFLRDIGRHFSVNKMIAAESYRMRIETTGLSFIEFNYMLLQAYDFLYLFRNYKCSLQLGGNDQWGNIVAGIDLIRRVERGESFGLTFPLVTTASGSKMGKTEKGAIWLDAERTSPYNYYQYWINTDDRDVKKFLNLFTFLPTEEIDNIIGQKADASIRKAKEILAFETTTITHGYEEAVRAQESAKSLFYGQGSHFDSVPETILDRKRIQEGISAFILFTETGLCPSRSEARRLLNDGGGYINNKRIDKFDAPISESSIQDNMLLLRAGKKKYHKIIFKK